MRFCNPRNFGNCSEFCGFGSRRFKIRRNFPRRSSNGIFLGVCAGVAEYFVFPVTFVRIVFIMALFFTGIFPMLVLYLIAAFIMEPPKKGSGVIYQGMDASREDEIKREYREYRSKSVDSLKRTFDDLDDRLRNIEDIVTAKENDWDRRYSEYERSNK